MHEGSRSAVIAALLANVGIAVSKLVGFFITGAASLLAEGVHSLVDTANQGLLLLGGHRSKQEASPEHPFGYGRERYFWAFVVALVLFLLGGLFAINEGIEKLRHPHDPEQLAVAIGILLFAMVLETLSLRTAVREARHDKARDESWWAFIRRSKGPELPVVLLEDTGAEIGLVLALIGVVMAKVTGEPRWDAAGSLGIGILLVVIAGVLVVEMKSLLIGESASPADLRSIWSALSSAPDVRSVIHLRAEHLGPDELLVAAKVEFSPDLSFAELAERIDGAEVVLRTVVPSARFVYLEPDVSRTPT
jgi:cation diffusion facilitator family transporter